MEPVALNEILTTPEKEQTEPTVLTETPNSKTTVAPSTVQTWWPYALIAFVASCIVVGVIVGIIVQGGSDSPAASDSQYEFCGSGHTYIRLLGQAIIQWDLRIADQDVVDAFEQVLKTSHPDVVFSDLELAVRGRYGGACTRGCGADNHHEAGPWVLDLLREYGVNILATSNNHAWDLGAEGIMSALEELDNRNFPYAGSGLTENDAIRPAEMITKHGTKVGLLALVSAPTLNTLGGIATATRPGVNSMQLDPATHLTSILPDRLAAQISAHQAADPNYDILISYHHNHYFEVLPGGVTDETVISNWWRNWAHTAIDNGADIYVSHGSTLLHGVDFYQGKPVLWGLGSTWFQTRKVDGFYSAPNFESVITDICIEQNTGETKAMRFIPVVLTEQGPGVPNTEEWRAGRGVPSVAQNDRGLAILNELKDLSGVNIIVDEHKYEAYVKFPIEQVSRPAKAGKPILKETNDLDGERYD
jgi:poly-gamma-glutamate synthesis protein (capsule biosynthesis protein)